MYVEIWSDIACPWCYVGKRRFERALEQFAHRDEVEVIWRAFELDPSAPDERSGDYVDLLGRKYGRSREQAQAMLDQMTQAAAADGLDFHFERVRSGRTFDGHRLVHLATLHGKQDAMKERLLKAYLEEGELMSDHAALQRLGEEVGLPADAVREVLVTERFAEEVRDDERTAASVGISAVPCFVVDRKMAMSGAQDPEMILKMLEKGWEAHAPIPIVAGGEACGPDGC